MPSTAVIIAYDDSDGWYDHVMPPITIQSSDDDAIVVFSKFLDGRFTRSGKTDAVIVVANTETNTDEDRAASVGQHEITGCDLAKLNPFKRLLTRESFGRTLLLNAFKKDALAQKRAAIRSAPRLPYG